MMRSVAKSIIKAQEFAESLINIIQFLHFICSSNIFKEARKDEFENKSSLLRKWIDIANISQIAHELGSHEILDSDIHKAIQ